ncbi:uncharacterized protein N7479_001899 [Penicillium vulpinum]|uniref:Uncharacterized protein n=1 Tax=Penicillium vulpinum TaxID=29845 RepID=A0A1V6S5L5_9EURO|nr:uncharacterized protein N7479_001899 [Penicillium vulpinum]KAJ5971981.1 hypothetical protein N7479_001899 [Penicillium vulpinum]OQE08913.1 hypothetical protein PENVUL_c008G01441 [Penicillium vulpinum]
MSSNTAGVAADAEAEKSCVICSIRPGGGSREDISTVPRTHRHFSFSSLHPTASTHEGTVANSQFDRLSGLSYTSPREAIMTGPETDMHSGLSSVYPRETTMTGAETDRHSGLSPIRPNDGPHTELSVWFSHNSKEDTESYKPAEARFAVQAPEGQDQLNLARYFNRDRSQVNGSGTSTTGKRYYLKHLKVPPNPPNRDSTDMNPKNETRIDLMDKRNFKTPVKYPYTDQNTKETAAQTPEGQDKSSLTQYFNMDHGQVGGSGMAPTRKRFYLKHLTVPPNSPNRNDDEKTPFGQQRIDFMDDRNFKPAVKCPYIDQDTKVLATQTPEKQGESSPAKYPSMHDNQVCGSGKSTAPKRYYLKHLTVPPNSPNRDSDETTSMTRPRIDLMDKRNFKVPVEYPYTDRTTNKIRRMSVNSDSTVTNENINHRAMHRSSNYSSLRAYIVNSFLNKSNAPDSDGSGSETEKEDSAAKGAGAQKTKEAANGRAFVQRREENVNDQQ